MSELCSICRENMDETRQHYMLVCNHRFHTECIIDSLRTNNECPICRDRDGNNPFVSNNYNNSYETDNWDVQNNNVNKKKILKIKKDDIDNIIKLKNDIIESDATIKKLRDDAKSQLKIFKKNSNIIYKKLKSFQGKLDKKYRDDIKEYIISISLSNEFQCVSNSRYIYKEKMNELYKILNIQIIDMGIPLSALDSLKFDIHGKTQFEKVNNIYNDGYYTELYSIINKSVKKVNNNIILTI